MFWVTVVLYPALINLINKFPAITGEPFHNEFKVLKKLDRFYEWMLRETCLIAETSSKKCTKPCSSPAIDVKNERELYSIAFMDEYQIIFSPKCKEDFGQVLFAK